jgi:hypothetical protein
MMLGRSHARPSQPAFHTFGEKIDKRRMVVWTGYLLKRFAARAHKGVATLLLQLFEGFEAVGGEGRGQHEKFLEPGRGQTLELVIRVGRQPGLALQPGLK